MNNNDILRRVRYIFDFSDGEMIRLFGLADYPVSRAQVSDWLKKDDNPTAQTLEDEQLALFLNGLINDKRGKKEGPAMPPEKVLNNNIIFKKLRIALQLRDEAILEIFELVEMPISKHELSAFFRRPTQSQYRECQDQYLRYFLNGLRIKYRSGIALKSRIAKKKNPPNN